MSAPGVKAVGATPVASMAARQLLLLSAFNVEGLQNVGFAYSLLPVLRQVHGDDPEALGEALARHLAPVNTHPYFAAPLLGAVAALEAQGRPGEAVRLKEMAAGPLASMADQFFWVGLRPTAALLAALLLAWGSLLGGVLVFLVLFALPQLVLRLILLVRGWREQRQIVARLARLDLPRWTRRVAVLGGAAAGAVAASMGAAVGDGLPALLAFPSLGLAGLVLVRRRVPPLVLLYGVAALCLLLAGLAPGGG